MRKLLAAPLAALALLAAAPAHASDVPTVFVHTAPGSPDGTGSWAWAKPGVPLTVRAEAPSAAASKLLRLEQGDLIQTTGHDDRRYQVVTSGALCSGLYDVVFRVGAVCVDAVAY